MSLLVFMFRQQELKSRINSKNFELMQEKQKLMDLQAYSTSVSDGSVSMNDLMTAPSGLFNRMLQYAGYSHQAATAGAQQNYQTMAASGMLNQQGYNTPQMQQVIFQNLYEQQRANFQKQEERLLNEQNKKIDTKCLQLENELKMLQSEYDSLKEATDAAIKDSAPRYVA